MDPLADVCRSIGQGALSRRARTGAVYREFLPRVFRGWSVPLVLPTDTEAPFLVPAFDGPEPQPVKDGTTHVLRNPNPGASDFNAVQYTIHPGGRPVTSTSASRADVDLGPLVIDASFRPESSPDDVEELYAVLGSIAMDRY